MFYFTGTMCELLPDSVDLVKAHGHEIVTVTVIATHRIRLLMY